MKERLSKLLCIKSLVTLTLTLLVFVLALKGTITADNVMEIFKLVIVFYFGTQAEKSKGV